MMRLGKYAGRGGRQRQVSRHRRAGRLKRPPQMRLTPGYLESTHCQQCFRKPPAPHAAVARRLRRPPGQQPLKSHRTPHQPNSPRIPDPSQREDTVQPSPPRVHPYTVQTRVPRIHWDPTNRSRPCTLPCTGPPHPRRWPDSRRSPTQHEHIPHAGTARARTLLWARMAGPGNTAFRTWQPCAHGPGNKTTASEHGMGSGGSAADAMAIGCPGAERRGEPFLVLSHFWTLDFGVFILR